MGRTETYTVMCEIAVALMSGQASEFRPAGTKADPPICSFSYPWEEWLEWTSRPGKLGHSKHTVVRSRPHDHTLWDSCPWPANRRLMGGWSCSRQGPQQGREPPLLPPEGAQDRFLFPGPSGAQGQIETGSLQGRC